MTKLIAYNPDDRVSARQALRHNYFRELRQAEKKVRGPLHQHHFWDTLGTHILGHTWDTHFGTQQQHGLPFPKATAVSTSDCGRAPSAHQTAVFTPGSVRPPHSLHGRVHRCAHGQAAAQAHALALASQNSTPAAT